MGEDQGDSSTSPSRHGRVGHRSRSVATRSQHLGSGGPEERWWMGYTASIHQPAPESVHCAIPISAMENTCGGGMGRAGNILKAVPRFLGGRAGSTWGPGNRPDPICTDRSLDLADPRPVRPREHARETRLTAAIRSARREQPRPNTHHPLYMEESGWPKETRTLTLPWLTEPLYYFRFTHVGHGPTLFFSVMH